MENVLQNAIKKELWKKVIIFGCGNYGVSAYDFLDKNDIDIVGFMDNNNMLWNRKLYGKTIFNPNELENLKGYTFLVANANYWNEIEQQLISAGCKDVVIYSTEE